MRKTLSIPGKRVLLVDYDPKNLTHTRELLEGAGFDVSTCGDGIAALDQFKTLSPDLVLLSAMLPKMHGFEVCSSIRKLPGGASTPVVIITDVYKGKRYRVDAINKYGATEYIERPIPDANLVSILTGLVKENGGGGESAAQEIPADQKTIQLKSEDLKAKLKDDAAFLKPKNVSEKPKSRDDIERKLEQSLAGLDLDVGRKPKPKPKPAEPPKAEAKPAAPAAAPPDAPAPAPVQTAGPTVILGKADPQPTGTTFTSEDLFTDVIASVERELQGESQKPAAKPVPPAAPPPPAPAAAKPAAPPAAASTGSPAPVVTPTVVLPRPEAKPPEPPKPVESAKTVEAPKVAEPPRKGVDSDMEKKLSSTLSGLKKDKPAVSAKPAAPAPAPPAPKAPEPPKKAEPPKPEPRREPPKPAEPPKVAEPAKAPAPPKPEPPKAPEPPKPAPAPVAEAKPAAAPAPAPAARPAVPAPAAKSGEEGINFGQYLLLSKIATGGMAELYKAKRKGVEGFEKILAIKKILPHMSDNEEFITMFIDEAKLAAQLTHHNVCQIFDLGKIETSYYIAMEYVHGKDLRAVLKVARSKEKPMPVELAILIISRICSALDYAHRKRDTNGQPLNLVHRDVSPQNILISYEGDVKLVDFGIAKAATKVHVTQHGALKGKLLYMSPEQAWGRAVDKRSDLFSLGVVLYELLTGRPLFFDDNDTEVTILEKVREAKIVPVRELNAKVPGELEKIINKALNKNPEGRYQVASEMQKDLDNLFYTEQYNATSGSLANYVRSLFPEEWGQETGGASSTIILDKEASQALKGSQPAIIPPAPPAPPAPPKPAPPAPVVQAAPPPPPAPAPAPPQPAPPKAEKAQPVAARPAEDARIEPPAPQREPVREKPQPKAPEPAVPAQAVQAPGFRDISIPDILAPPESKPFPKIAIGIIALVLAVFVVVFLIFRKPSTEEPKQAAPAPTQQPAPSTPQPTTPAPTTTTTPPSQPAATTPSDAEKKKEELEKKIQEEQQKLQAADDAKKKEDARQLAEQQKLADEAKQKEQEKKTEPVAPPKEEPKVVEQAPPPVETPPPAQQQAEAPKEETPPPVQQAPAQPTVNEGDLVALDADVIKPEVVSKVNPSYPPVAAAKKIEGTVILSILISENGSVVDTKVLRGAGGPAGLNEAAQAAVKKWKFRPAVKQGKRVKVWMTYPIVFKLQ